MLSESEWLMAIAGATFGATVGVIAWKAFSAWRKHRRLRLRVSFGLGIILAVLALQLVLVNP